MPMTGEKLAYAIERAEKLSAQTRMAIHVARRVVIDAERLVILSRAIRYTAKTLRDHHFLPR